MLNNSNKRFDKIKSSFGSKVCFKFSALSQAGAGDLSCYVEKDDSCTKPNQAISESRQPLEIVGLCLVCRCPEIGVGIARMNQLQTIQVYPGIILQHHRILGIQL